MVEMTIEAIRVSLMNYQRVVILREKSSDRYLPIWIGPAEADAIARMRLEEVEWRLASLRALQRELERMLAGCKSGHVADCRVIEVLADHSKCASAEH